MAFDCKFDLRLFESRSLREESFTGLLERDFRILGGSRLVLSVRVISLTGTLNVGVGNDFEADGTFANLDAFPVITAPGYYKLVLTDFHSLFKLKFNVGAGNVELHYGVTSDDNSSSTDANITLPPGLATETTLQAVLAAVDQLEGYTDGLEALITTGNSLLTAINTNTDQLEGYVDGLEGLVTATNALLTTIRDNADTVETLLTTIVGHVDGLETLVTSSNSLLTQIRDNADTVEALLTSIDGHVDGLETLITSTNTKLEDIKTLINTVIGHVDGIETLITATNTKLDTANVSLASIDSKVATQTTLAAVLAAVDGLEGLATTANSLLTAIGSNTDGLEGFVDGLETLVTSSNSLLTQIRDNADTLETLIGTSNTQLTAINANTDGLEALITSTNSLLTQIRDNADTLETLIGTSNTQLSAINANTDGIETLLTSANALLTTIRDNADTVETALGNILTEIASAHYTMNAAFNKATAIAGQLDDVSTTDATENNVAPARITPKRAIHTNLRDNAGVELGTTTNPIVATTTIKDPVTGNMASVNGTGGLETDPKSLSYSSYSPDPASSFVGHATSKLDASGRLETHSSSLTDEGSFRDDFSGSSLNTTLTGSVNFTNGSDVITGSGTLFITEVKSGMYIKKTTDSETLWVRVSEVLSDTELSLEEDYAGTTATTTGHRSNWKTTTGPGSFAVANSNVTIASGTAAGTVTLFRDADYGPFAVSFKFSISQRIANQTVVVGVRTPVTSPQLRAVFQFTGTDNTAVTCISASSSAAADTQTTNTFLPNNLTTASAVEFAINVSNDQISFVINGITVATHRDHIIGAYDFLQTVVSHTAAAVVTNTNVVVDWHNFYNVNQLEIANNFLGKPLVIAPVSSVERVVSTYSAASAAVVAAASPTDIFTITGSATKVIRIKRIGFSLSATNPVSYNVFVLKRSTANTGGTSTTLNVVPNDSDDVAGTAVVRTYTANPTVGTLVGNIRSYKVTVPQATPLGGVGSSRLEEIRFGDNGGKGLVLRGTSEVLAINAGGVTLTGNSWLFFVEWIEE